MHLEPGLVLMPWIDPRVEVRDSARHGRGMFARAPFEAGEVVLVWGGTVFTEEDLRRGRAHPDSVTRVDEGLYLGDPAGTDDAEDYCLNHGCDPSLWMRDAITLETRRIVAEGDELTVDYALWETRDTWVLDPCRCGSPLCRGRVSGGDWRIHDLQKRYRGHFSPVLERWIQGR